MDKEGRTEEKLVTYFRNLSVGEGKEKRFIQISLLMHPDLTGSCSDCFGNVHYNHPLEQNTSWHHHLGS